MVEREQSAVLERLGAGAERVERAVSKVAEPTIESSHSSDLPLEEELIGTRWDAYRFARSTIREFANNPDWRDHPVLRDLLDRTFELESRLEADSTGEDRAWKLREVRDEIVDILDLLRREIEHQELDEPSSAASFVLQKLAGIRQQDIAELMGVEARTLRTWRTRPVELRKSPDRVVLVAQLTYDLQHSMTPAGIVAWFKRSRPQLGGRTPLDLLNEDATASAESLRSLARGARGQLAT